ncbi:MAG: hypothetical protein V3U79_07590 [Dehalococcoidia bacterium]
MSLIIDKLLNFPVQLFLAPDSQAFFSLMKTAFLDSSVLIIANLLDDGGKNTISLPQFRNLVRQKWIKKEHQKSFDDVLRLAKFGRTVQTISSNIRLIRNHFVGHVTIDDNLQPKIAPHVVKVTLVELKSVTQSLSDLLTILCFGHQRMNILIDYSSDVQQPANSDPRSDIEYFLDLLVQDNAYFNLPEQNPKHWNILKSTISEEEREILNAYRSKFGRPEI